jgi:hypothetical protein
MRVYVDPDQRSGNQKPSTVFVFFIKKSSLFISIKLHPEHGGNVDGGFFSISSTPQDGARQARVTHSHAGCRGSVRDQAFGAQR